MNRTTPTKIGPDIFFIASQRGGRLKPTGTKSQLRLSLKNVEKAKIINDRYKSLPSSR